MPALAVFGQCECTGVGSGGSFRSCGWFFRPFFLGPPFVDAIDAGFGICWAILLTHISMSAILRELLVNGIFARCWQALSFFAQIILLFLLFCWRDSGSYSAAFFARSPCAGRISWRSFIPLLSSLLSAVRAIMAHRRYRTRGFLSYGGAYDDLRGDRRGLRFML